jgi:hypothetical protein
MMNATDLVLLSPGAEAPALSVGAETPWVTLQLPIETADWPAIAAALQAEPEAWADAGLVLVLGPGVRISGEAVVELFRIMRQHGLTIAQPSLTWRSHFVEPVTLHNPSFAWRHTSRIDTRAMAFEASALRRSLPLAASAASAAEFGRLLAATQARPDAGVAVIDAVQAERTTEPAADEWPQDGWPDDAEPAVTWGGCGQRGQRVTLFDATREECLGLLTAGFACAVQEPQAIGEVFLAHFVRSLETPPRPIMPAPAIQPSPLSFTPQRLRRSPIVPAA